MNRTDLAAEAAEMLCDKTGMRVVSRCIGGVSVTDVRAEKEARSFGKPAGRYITLQGEPTAQCMAALLRRAAEQLIPREGTLLIAGLGNPDVTHDSLGALAVRSVCAGKGRRYRVAAIETDVAARTGIETARLIRAAAGELKADCVVAVDSLACKSPRYIGRTVQITDAGIVPGSGASGDRREISAATMGIPVVAVGVPLMSELASVTGKDRDKGYAVTTGDINITARLWAETIAFSLNELAGVAHTGQ